jgi:hypothetical protein
MVAALGVKAAAHWRAPPAAAAAATTTITITTETATTTATMAVVAVAALVYIIKSLDTSPLPTR